MENDLLLKTELAAALKKKAILEARRDFYAYVRLMAHLMLPEDFVDGRHIRLICAELMRVERGDEKQLMIFLPPGAMKSVLLKLFVSWCFGRNPSWPIIGLSHTEDLADKHSREIRDFMQLPDYGEVFPKTAVSNAAKNVGLWITTEGGAYKSAGAQTGIAGFRFRLGIIDDPLNEKTAFQPDVVRKINNNYGRGFKSRGLPDRRIIIVHTRWLVNDLAGFVLRTAKKDSDKFKVIKIPALLDETASKLLKLPEGTSYWPEMWPTEYFEDMRDNPEVLAFSDWISLYQQEPVALDGVIFKKGHFKEWEEDELPKMEMIIVSADTAYGEKQSNDFSVLQVWGLFKKKNEEEIVDEKAVYNALMLANRKGQWAFPELVKQAKAVNKDFKPDLILIEKRASGQSLAQTLRMANLPIKEVNPDRDKVTRAHIVTPVLDAGRVYLPKRRWAEGFLVEAYNFPRGEHDDQVDAAVHALQHIKLMTNMGEEDSFDEDDGDEKHYRKRERWFKRKLTSGA